MVSIDNECVYGDGWCQHQSYHGGQQGIQIGDRQLVGVIGVSLDHAGSVLNCGWDVHQLCGNGLQSSLKVRLEVLTKWNKLLYLFHDWKDIDWTQCEVGIYINYYVRRLHPTVGIGH